MIARRIIRCTVYDGDRPIEMFVQPVPYPELRVAFRRVHFMSRLVAGMEKGYRVVFETREEKLKVK